MSAHGRALVELWIAGALWGFGYVATRWALESFQPFFLVSLRFILVILVGSAIAVSFPSIRRTLNTRSLLRAVHPGFWLALFLVLQTMGLQHTTIARAGFLSALYVVWIPLLHSKQVSRLHWICVLIAVIGTAIMCGVDLNTPLQKGDLLVLLCSVGAAIHIILIERVSKKETSSFCVNFFQSTTAAVFALPVAMLVEDLSLESATPLGWLGLTILALGSTLIAFLIQVRAQRTINPSTVSLFFLLESPFAALFGWLVFSEVMNLQQLVGAATILAAVALSIRATSYKPAT